MMRIEWSPSRKITDDEFIAEAESFGLIFYYYMTGGARAFLPGNPDYVLTNVTFSGRIRATKATTPRAAFSASTVAEAVAWLRGSVVAENLAKTLDNEI